MIRTVLVVAAAVCFLLGAVDVGVPRVNLVALGLFFLTVGAFLLK